MKKIIKYLLTEFFKRQEYLLVPEYKLDSIFLTRRLQKIINLYDIDCVIDVGANIGQFGRFLREDVDYKGLIVSFEPDPDTYQALEDNTKDDESWIAYNIALGDEQGEFPFNVMQGSSANSFLTPDYSHTGPSKYRVVKSTITVPVERLDAFVSKIKEQYRISKIFLKIDTQGYDLKVFSGCSDCLNLIRGVQTEVSVMPIYENMPSFCDSLHLFKKMGYEVSGLYSISEERFPYAMEFDCIYLPK